MNKRKNIRYFLTIVLVGMMCFWGVQHFATSMQSVWAGETDTISIQEGASVRVVQGSSGIRFKGTINKNYLQQLVSTSGVSKVTYGILITPMYYLNHVSDFTVDALSAKYVHDPYLKIPAEHIIDNGDFYEFRCAMTGLSVDAYEWEFAARSYIEVVHENGTIEYIYSNFDESANVRSIKSVAQATLKDTEKNYTDNEKLILNNYVNKKAEARQWSVCSPDEKLKLNLFYDANGSLSYEVSDGETKVLDASALGFELKEEDLSKTLTYVSEETKTASGSYTNISSKHSQVDYEYQELKVTFFGKLYYLDVTMRAYDDGYAFRCGIRAIDGSRDTVTVVSEDTEFSLPQNSVTWAQTYTSNSPTKGEFFSYEEAYTRKESNLLSGSVFPMPLLYQVGNSDVYSLVTESELIGSGYYGSYLREESENEGEGILHTIHSVAGIANPDNMIQLPFESPWRVAAVGTLNEVCESEMVEKVYDDVEYWKPENYDSLSAEEQKTYTYDWVEPGVVAWNWLAYTGTKPQSDWELQREYVDLAQEMGWSYVILDGGWDQTEENVKSFTQYAAERGVKVIVWCDAYGSFNNGSGKKLAENLALWKSWGVAGIKVDFFDGQYGSGLTHQGEDIETIKWYETIYQTCAKLQMVVSCHGCNKPTGETRLYPNVLNREAVLGNELQVLTADASVNNMFIRNVIGSTDFTPMVETKYGSLTVAHEMALAVLYQSGLPSMADYADTYRNELIQDFYKQIPAGFDEMVFLDGELDGYYCAAVRKGDTWFVAGINSSGTSRTVELDTSFLGEGTYDAVSYNDPGWSLFNQDIIEKETMTIQSGSSINMSMKKSGGFVIVIK